MSAPALQGDGAALVPPADRPAAQPEHTGPAPVAIHVALAAVMADVRALGKNDRNSHFNYEFRGIDATMNALGPAMRTHGVVVLPQVEHIEYRDVQTGAATRRRDARECTVRVRYTFVGPKGDRLDVVTCGEAIDEADKGTAKAMSVAMRIALLQTFVLPTSDPDPDSSDIRRADRSETSEREQSADREQPDAAPSGRALTLAAAGLARRLLEADKPTLKAMWEEVHNSPAAEVDVSGLIDAAQRDVFGVSAQQPITVRGLRGLVAAHLAAQEQATAKAAATEQPAPAPEDDAGEIM